MGARARCCLSLDRNSRHVTSWTRHSDRATVVVLSLSAASRLSGAQDRQTEHNSSPPRRKACMQQQIRKLCRAYFARNRAENGQGILAESHVLGIKKSPTNQPGLVKEKAIVERHLYTSLTTY
ncbi:hypothetical protein JDV02_002459 [Purpureocillium takamizusanense]|uniref:Uncharacterized protein n=1 Tax=Purpureocillium takamizusanense TaxID=2060973 RepID=A0A9Q8V7R5_9HYPO|nr:uncharacterized protein JDV02_002459 [Purpureocillium takamizusanense]UNI15978.1 hypothetical protein JDV02_002459 [Purpureocillium takamizusanense]